MKTNSGTRSIVTMKFSAEITRNKNILSVVAFCDKWRWLKGCEGIEDMNLKVWEESGIGFILKLEFKKIWVHFNWRKQSGKERVCCHMIDNEWWVIENVFWVFVNALDSGFVSNLKLQKLESSYKQNGLTLCYISFWHTWCLCKSLKEYFLHNWKFGCDQLSFYKIFMGIW